MPGLSTPRPLSAAIVGKRLNLRPNLCAAFTFSMAAINSARRAEAFAALAIDVLQPNALRRSSPTVSD
jgi:hypothetical protein